MTVEGAVFIAVGCIAHSSSQESEVPSQAITNYQLPICQLYLIYLRKAIYL
ncbi:MAG: hypothetical protein JGK37_19955 [Microcoleus sp. PH2017_06_SFM_O_A]|nr:hypothetical protein [Microcoleus sp. PH2017_06_SFM_O_A]